MAGLLDTVLDMSLAARMARAREMGFNVDTPLYHGTTRQFTRFDPSLGSEYGIYTTPRKEYAKAYGGGDAIPLYGKMKNPLYVEWKGEISPKDLTKADIDRIKDAGYDSVVVVKKGQPIDQASEVVLFEPEQVRSVHAAFDPARASSSDLLAGVAPWAMAGGLGLLAGAMPGESRADKLSREMTHREPSRNVSGLERLQAGLQAGGATPVPVASDVMGLLGDALMYYNDPSSRTWKNAGLTGLGLLPFVP